MIWMMLGKTLTTIPSLRCLAIGPLGITLKLTPFNGLGNFLHRHPYQPPYLSPLLLFIWNFHSNLSFFLSFFLRFINYLRIASMPPILVVIRNWVLLLMLKLEIYGFNFYHQNVCCLLAVKYAFLHLLFLLCMFLCVVGITH